MRVGFAYDEQWLLHDNGPGHPERPERLQTLRRLAESAPYCDSIVWHGGREATREDLERVHAGSYLDRLADSEQRSRTVFDVDTSANEHSYRAARLAAGAALAAVERALNGDEHRSFLAVRPPGHHALFDRAMGFCFLNSAAVAAASAVSRGLSRVAVIDWDVHHGNGTQEIFADRSDVLYVSLHQAPHYPGTGQATEIGTGDGRGFTVNLPFPAGTTGSEYLAAMDAVVEPVLDQYRPELLLVSAGFDAHHRDPLAGMLLGRRAFEQITERLLAAAARHAAGRIVHVLEGGYDLEGLREGADAVLSVLAAHEEPRASAAPDAARSEHVSAVIRDVARAHRGFWDLDC